jgi:uncharacterized protein YkwD
MRTLRVHIPLLLTAAIALGGAPSASASTVCASADAVPFTISTAKLAGAAACLVNQERARYQLGALRLNRRLARAALGHATDMVSRDYFSHDTAGGGSFIDRIFKTGYTSRNAFPSLGEDLAWGSGALGTARSIVDAWMQSPGHRANILDRKFRDMGMGVALGTPEGDSAGATYALDFGSGGRR